MFLTRNSATRRLARKSGRVLGTKMLPGVSLAMEKCYLLSRYRRFSGTDTCTAAAFEDDEDDNQNTNPNTAVDYFSLLGLSRRFLLDPKELQNSYRQLMTKHHPDMRNHREVDDDDDTSDASEITHAYHTLRKPHTRATHLLELVGRPMEDETTNSASLVGPEFLMHVMEWRETIDSIPGAKDSERDEEASRELEGHLSRAQEETEEVLKQLDEAFRQRNLDRALELSAQLQYWNRIEETIVEKL